MVEEKSMLIDMLVMQTLIDVVSKVEPDVLDLIEKRLRATLDKLLNDLHTAYHQSPQPTTTRYICDNGEFLREDDSDDDPEKMN